MAFKTQMKELEKRRGRALEMGGRDKIKKQHDKGRFTARERIEKLLDPDSFLEVGMFNHSDVSGMENKTPADMNKYKSILKKYKDKKPERIWALLEKDSELDSVLQGER